MPVYPFQGVWPRFGERVFLAPSAEVAGDVEVGDDVSFWFHTAARGDVNWIRIGAAHQRAGRHRAARHPRARTR